MSLLVPVLARHQFDVDNFGVNPSTTPGATIVPGTSNAEGAYSGILSSPLAEDIFGFLLQIQGGGVANAAKPQLFDFGIDPAGGTSYVTTIENIVAGASGGTDRGPGHVFFFPLFIKSGSTVAARCQGAHATAGTVKVLMRAYGKRSRADVFPVGKYAETIGTITNSGGVAFTPGNAADGTWVSLGTTVKPLWWWQIAYQVDNATITAETCHIELAYGDGSNKHRITRTLHRGQTTETIGNNSPTQITPYEAYCPVPAGAELWIRGRCDSAPDSGYNAVAIGIGG